MFYKFRGKEVFKGNWIYGDLNQNIDKDIICSIKINNNLVDLITISYFIGLQDNQNNDIYIYDIIQYKTKKYIVFYNIEQCAICLYNLNNISDLNKHNIILPELNWWKNNKKHIQIIGNIFDNFELINNIDVIKIKEILC